ncbi:MAG: hypothetical protein AAF559_10205 [Pseudomonadota bacterium]
MSARVLYIDEMGALELDDTKVNLEEYEEALKVDKEKGDRTPIEVHCPIFTSDKSPVGQVFQAILELSDRYDHPSHIMMGSSK